MRKIGFTDFARDRWHFSRSVTQEKLKSGYGGFDFEVSFSVTIPKYGSDIRIDVLDEAFCQPYDYQYILEKIPTLEVALQISCPLCGRRNRAREVLGKIKPLCHTSEKTDACSGNYKYSYVGPNVQNKLLTKCSKCPWYKENRKRDGDAQ